MMSSRQFGPLYVGATTNLVRRVWEHRNRVVPGFTERHGLHRLVWFEEQQDFYRALQRERNIKHWVRAWKVELVEAANPEWDDLWNLITR